MMFVNNHDNRLKIVLFFIAIFIYFLCTVGDQSENKCKKRKKMLRMSYHFSLFFVFESVLFCSVISKKARDCQKMTGFWKHVRYFIAKIGQFRLRNSIKGESLSLLHAHFVHLCVIFLEV